MINLKTKNQMLGIYNPNAGGIVMDTTSTINLGWNLVVFDFSNYDFYKY